MKQFIVFDGNSILNRAFYGIRPLTTKDGQPTNAIYGFLNIMFKNIAMLGTEPEYVAVAFDMKAPTFRHKQYSQYKAGRKGMPDELAAQLPFAKSIPALLGYTVLEKEGYEADDILGTIASICEKNGVGCTIVTGDRDSLQLVSDSAKVFLAATNETKIYDVDRIKNDYGVTPRQLIDVKSIMGDTSDNIPGVSGIGEKGALKLIAEYGSLDGVYASVDSIKGTLKDKLINGKDSAYMSYDLARIFREVPVSDDINDYAVKERNTKELFDTLTRLELVKMIEKLGLTGEKTETEQPGITFDENDETGLDVSRTYYVYPENGNVYMTDGAKGYIFASEHIKNSDTLKELFGSSAKLCVWNRKELAHSLDDIGVTLCKEGDDISLKAYVSSSSESGGMTPGKVIFRYLEVNADAPEDVISLLPRLYKAVSADADETLYGIELKLSDVLYDMEKTGFAVDRQALENYSEVLDRQIKEYESTIYAMAGTEFNINSPKQLSDVLFEQLKLPHGKKKNKNDSYPTDADVLEKLKRYHPVIDCILSYRKLAKLKGTYADGLLKVISSDGRIHTTFKQTLTQTGRLSSAEPNLQNIPVRQEAGKEFRRFFIAGSDDKVLIDADYSQIELRVLAHISHDKALIDAFNNGRDIHALTASQVFSVPLDAVTSDMRKKAKAVNFGIVYGISAFSLAEDIGTARWMAEEYINKYFETYSGVYRYMNEIVEQARKDKYVTTLFGRRRFIPELLSPKKTVQAFGERIARNTPIQGTAADIIKKAMVDVCGRLNEEGMKTKLILQVHDELILESPVSEADKAKAILKDCMENAYTLDVPLVVDTGVGRSWYETHG